MPMRIPMIAMTTSSSISVNPLRGREGRISGLQEPESRLDRTSHERKEGPGYRVSLALGGLLCLARQDQLHDQALLALRVGGVLAVDDLAATILHARDGPRAAPLLAAVLQRLAVEDDLLAVELVLATPQ